MKPEPGEGVPVAERLLAILTAFDPGARRLTLSQLSRRAGIPLTTTLRLARSLVDVGALQRTDDGTYEVGRRMWEIGLLAPVQAELGQIAAPYLQDVFTACGEAVYLAVRQDTRALYVHRIVGTHRPRVIASAGTKLPLHATGVGKVLLAHAPDDVTEAVVTGGLARFTARTIVDPERLRRDLHQVRVRGYARTSEELSRGSAAVAVPVTRLDGTVIAAVGVVTGNVGRDLSRMVPALSVAARGLSRALPYGIES